MMCMCMVTMGNKLILVIFKIIYQIKSFLYNKVSLSFVLTYVECINARMQEHTKDILHESVDNYYDHKEQTN